jgi:two-component system, LytTR family, response regulator
MIKAIHIEDEPRNVALLQTLVQTHCGNSVELVGNASGIPEAIALINEVQPQLVYLDIELTQGTAFELLEKIDTRRFAIVFLTAFNQYAVKAFRHHAVDYLLKPINIAQLKEATAMAVEKINQQAPHHSVLEALRELRMGLTVNKIGIPVADGILFVHAHDIVSAEARGSYTLLHLQNGQTITAVKSLKDIETHLPTLSFARVHNSWLVNTQYIKKYYRGKNSYMEMEDRSTIPVSLRKKSSFLQLLNGHE